MSTNQKSQSPPNSLSQQEDPLELDFEETIISDQTPEADLRPTRIGPYEVHPLANCFPMMRGDQLEDFLKDIKEHGQLSPVVLLEGKILEGRNRALAAYELGKELNTVEFDELGTDQKPLEYVISSNLHRRHLSDKERVQLAAQLAKLLAEQKADAGGTQVPPEPSSKHSTHKKGPAALAASKMGVSKQAVNRALAREEAANRKHRQRIDTICGPEVIEKFDQGKILTEPGDLECFAKLVPDRMKALKPFVLKTATYDKAFDLEDNYDLRLRDRLGKLFDQGLQRASNGPLQLEESRVDHYRNALGNLIGALENHEVLALAGIEPGADPGQIDPQRIDELIGRCHHLNKERASDQKAEISLADILGRSTSTRPQSDNESGGADSQPEHSPEELQVIQRIATICGGNQSEEVEKWRRILSEKVKFEDLLAWDHNHDDEDVRRIGRLIHGDFGKGLRDAIRIVDRVIDGRTPLSFLINNCIAEGGRWEHFEGPYRVVVDKGADRQQIENRLRDLLRGTEHYPALEKALAQNSISEAKLKVLHSMPDEELEYFIRCALYGSQNKEAEFSFDESAL
jgi:hypothetical protein